MTKSNSRGGRIDSGDPTITSDLIEVARILVAEGMKSGLIRQEAGEIKLRQEIYASGKSSQAALKNPHDRVYIEEANHPGNVASVLYGMLSELGREVGRSLSMQIGEKPKATGGKELFVSLQEDGMPLSPERTKTLLARAKEMGSKLSAPGDLALDDYVVAPATEERSQVSERRALLERLGRAVLGRGRPISVQEVGGSVDRIRVHDIPYEDKNSHSMEVSAGKTMQMIGVWVEVTPGRDERGHFLSLKKRDGSELSLDELKDCAERAENGLGTKLVSPHRIGPREH